MRFEYRVLDDSEIERLHAASLRVLTDIGMKVYDDDLCALLTRKGVSVDEHQQMVRFSSELVEAAIRTAPRSFRMSDHKGSAIDIRHGGTLPAVYANAIKVWDWHTRQVRPSTLADLTTCVQLADAIPEVRIACPACLPGDVGEASQETTAIAVLLQNSSKLNMAAPHDGEEAAFWSEAVAIADQEKVGSSDPSVMFVVSPTSPLQIDPSTCQVLRHGAEKGIPLLISSCPIAGSTSPITLAGTTVQTHAEFLGMLTISQLLREGLPTIYGGSAGPMDLRTGSLLYGAPERNTMLCANIDIANFLDLPHFSSAGSVDSAWPDFQAGQAKALAWLTRMMKGTALGLWFGSLLTGTTVAPEQIVLDADLYRAVVSMLRGIPLDEERLGYEAIRRVGPGGNFLLDEHTLSFMRSGEYYVSPVANHTGEAGPDMLDRAHEQVVRIMRHRRPSVSDGVCQDLEVFLREYTRHSTR